MQCNQIQWTQWCHPSIAKAIEPTQAVNTINHTHPINQFKQAQPWHQSYQTNQANQPNQSNQACRQWIFQHNESHGTELDATDHIGLYGLALHGIRLCYLIERMVLSWVYLLDSNWIGLLTLDCVGYAVSGLDLNHCCVSFDLFRLHLTWLGFQLITLIDWLCWFCCLSPLHYAIILLLHKGEIWQVVEWIGWFGWLMRFGWWERFDAWHWIGLIGLVGSTWLIW